MTPMFIDGREVSRADVRDAVTDEIAVRACLHGEARGEPLIAQIAVGCVIRNRLHLGRWGSTYKQVCLASAQFSCFWGAEDDPNTIAVYALAARLLDHGHDTNGQLEWVTRGIVGDFVKEDVSRNSTHYLTTELYRSHPPSWARTAHNLATIGNHVFLGNIA